LVSRRSFRWALKRARNLELLCVATTREGRVDRATSSVDSRCEDGGNGDQYGDTGTGGGRDGGGREGTALSALLVLSSVVLSAMLWSVVLSIVLFGAISSDVLSGSDVLLSTVRFDVV